MDARMSVSMVEMNMFFGFMLCFTDHLLCIFILFIFEDSEHIISYIPTKVNVLGCVAGLFSSPNI